MKILHTADWHIGSFRGPEENGVNLRSQDTYRCIEAMVEKARTVHPSFVLVSGDIFHVAAIGQGRSHNEVLNARKYIRDLSACADHVIVMRGTPNHDSAEAFAELQAHFEYAPNVDIITEPKVLSFDKERLNIALVPGFDRGVYRAKFPGLSKDEENAAFTDEIAKLVIGQKALTTEGYRTVLMTHITVPGCNLEAGQDTFLQNFEPVLMTSTLNAANFDLVCLGHIHRPQELTNCHQVFYSGAINAMNFNDEGQRRGFYIHDMDETGNCTSEFFETPYRRFSTIYLEDDDIAAINSGEDEAVAQRKWPESAVSDKIVRVLYSCTEDHSKAFSKSGLEKKILQNGAFWVAEITPQKISSTADRTDMGDLDPEANLREYLTTHDITGDDQERLILKARPIITRTTESGSQAAHNGTFVPVSIDVKNYRNYKQEHFDFGNVRFCTINGQNGAGKSSLFMDAILDCLWEEPREGDLTGWIRNDEDAHSGAICFTFKIGENMFRLTRTRAKSGKATLNLAEFVDGQWVNRSKEKLKDTQQAVNELLGMDSMTFKSCALIMQDQYGIFLQAPKDERMAILGNLLGLGIYSDMEKAAWDTARQYGAKMRDAKTEIEMRETEIRSYGNPQEVIDTLNEEIRVKKRDEAEKREAKEQYEQAQKRFEEMSQKCSALLDGIQSLDLKRMAVKSSISSTQAIIDECHRMLEDETTITEKAAKYRALVDERPKLADKKAEFTARKEKCNQLNNRLLDLKVTINAKKLEVQNLQKEFDARFSTEVDQDTIYAKDDEYEQTLKTVDQLKEKRAAYQAARNDLFNADTRKATAQVWDMEIEKIRYRISDLERKAQLLDQSGCIDIEHASCMFLKDAIAAKQFLDTEKSRLEEKEKGKTQAIEKIEAYVQTMKKRVEDIGFDPSELAQQQDKLNGLAKYHNLAKQMRGYEVEKSAILARIESTQSNISELEKNRSTVILEQQRAAQEVDKLRPIVTEIENLDRQISEMKHWQDMENQLPVLRERKSGAESRMTDLTERLREINNDIEQKRMERVTLKANMDGAEIVLNGLQDVTAKLAAIESEISDLQKQVGAMEQRAEQISRMRKAVEELRKQCNGYSIETADYDRLKEAFGQDGIPHQIIRSIIPKLTSTANTILGQMTAGKMGVEFQTERVMKSNKNKEVVTLDILINEYGRSTLPYLSKSGGEKVKASLSVILSLAEIKAGTAGMQFGMLFIDEPPFLDSDGVQAYCDALQTIQERYPNLKIMAVTHDQSMKARFPQSVTVTKDEEGSHVIWD